MTDDEKKSGGEDAFSMFPDLMGGAPEPEQKKSAPAVSEPPSQPEVVPVAPVKHTPPPEPPDISWLVSGEFNAKSLSMGVPTALLLMSDGESKTGAADAFKTIGYQIEEADSEDQAILKMNSGMFAAVILHQDFVGGEIGVSVFHNFMKSLGMAVRRPIFYVLIGEQFHTLYDLEALSESANVVVNTNDVKQLGIIIRKGLKDYEKLFGPLVEAQRQQSIRS
jgi:hypothetical protein